MCKDIHSLILSEEADMQYPVPSIIGERLSHCDKPFILEDYFQKGIRGSNMKKVVVAV